MKNETVKALLMVVAGVVVTYFVTDYLKTQDAGSDAQVKAIAKEVYEDMNKTDSGLTVKAELQNVKGAVLVNGTKLDILISSVESLSED